MLGAASAIAPLSLLAVELWQRLSELVVANRLLKMATPASVDRVRAGLRTTLKDPTLEVYLWGPEQTCHVDVDGRPVDVAADDRIGVSGTDERRWLLAVETSRGEPLAVITADSALRRHRLMVDAALSVGGLALEQAQLQAAVQAHVEQIRTAQRRIVEAEANERKRVERDLHAVRVSAAYRPAVNNLTSHNN